MGRVRIIPLGTSSGVPTRNRNVSAVVVDLGPRWILLDCGEGTQHRLLQAPIRRKRLDAIFISHLHGDHLFGLPGLLAALSLRDQRTGALALYGPPGIREWIETTLRIAVSYLTYPLEIHEIHPETSAVEVRSARDYSVMSLPLDHRILALGYRIETRARGPKPGCKVAYCTDTRPCQNSIELGRDADLLIHEATYTSDLAGKAHERGHSTAREAGEIAAAADARQLLITHFSPRYGHPFELLEDAREAFGSTIAAQDLVELTVHSRPILEAPPSEAA